MVTAHEADILYMRNFLEEITQNKYDQGGATLQDLKPDTFESNEKSFRQRSDEFSSWVERIDQDFEKMLRLAAQMQECDKDKFIAEAQQEYRLGAEKVEVCRVSCVFCWSTAVARQCASACAVDHDIDVMHISLPNSEYRHEIISMCIHYFHVHVSLEFMHRYSARRFTEQETLQPL